MYIYKYIFKNKLCILLSLLLISVLSSLAMQYSINELGGPFTLKNVSAFFYQFAYILILYYVCIIVSFEYENKIETITESNFVIKHKKFISRTPIIMLITLFVTIVFYLMPTVYSLIFGSNIITIDTSTYFFQIIYVILFSIFIGCFYYLLQQFSISFYMQFIITTVIFFFIPYSNIFKFLNDKLFTNIVYRQIAFYDNSIEYFDILSIMVLNIVIISIIGFVGYIKKDYAKCN